MIKKYETKTWAIFLALFCSLFTSFGQLFLKIGSKTASFDLNLLTNYILILGMILYGIGAILLIFSLKGGELSVLYPLLASSFIWVSFLSMLFLNEKLSLIKYGGIILIITGIYFIGKGATLEKNG